MHLVYEHNMTSITISVAPESGRWIYSHVQGGNINAVGYNEVPQTCACDVDTYTYFSKIIMCRCTVCTCTVYMYIQIYAQLYAAKINLA